MRSLLLIQLCESIIINGFKIGYTGTFQDRGVALTRYKEQCVELLMDREDLMQCFLLAEDGDYRHRR